MLNELYASRCKTHHTQQQQPMSPALDVSVPVGSLAITDRNFDNLKIQFSSPEQQIEVAEIGPDRLAAIA